MQLATGGLTPAVGPPGFGPQWESGPGLIVLLVAGAIIVMSVFRIIDARARKRRETLPVARRAARAGSATPTVGLAELERRAGLALVASDERVTAATAEIDYARALDGDDVAAALGAEVDGTRKQLAAAFALQREAGSATSDETTRRAAYERIVQLTSGIDSALDGARESLERLRTLGAKAAQEAPALRTELEALDVAAGSATARLHDAGGRYSSASIEPGATALHGARAALARARTQLSAITAASSGEVARAGLLVESVRVNLRTAAERISTAQARLAELAALDLAVAEGIAALERDVEHARALGSTRLTTVADRFESEALTLRNALAAVNRDPAELGRRVVRADAAIDAEIRSSAASARAVEQAVAERSSALAGARMLVSTATNSLAAEPADDAARIRRDEALKLLAEARAALAHASRSDLPPADARDRADSAAHLARRSMAIARDGIAGTPAADGKMFGVASGGDGRISEFLAGLLDRVSSAIDDASNDDADAVDGPRPSAQPRSGGTAWTWEPGSP
ncbi:hypothetical protein [Agromyces italicus]|uniref:hypothetical protein n=1 Tax=Agromyces italicus TaxID=279572 RepID=UPI0003B4DC62|nr:hypothetical protein [Agromyces italicus]